MIELHKHIVKDKHGHKSATEDSEITDEEIAKIDAEGKLYLRQDEAARKKCDKHISCLRV